MESELEGEAVWLLLASHTHTAFLGYIQEFVQEQKQPRKCVFTLSHMIFRNFNAALDFLSLVTTRYTLAAPVHFLEMSSENDVPKLPFEPLKKPHYQSLSQQQRKRSYLLFSKNQEISQVHLFLTIFLAFYTWIVFIFSAPFSPCCST